MCSANVHSELLTWMERSDNVVDVCVYCALSCVLLIVRYATVLVGEWVNVFCMWIFCCWYIPFVCGWTVNLSLHFLAWSLRQTHRWTDKYKQHDGRFFFDAHQMWNLRQLRQKNNKINYEWTRQYGKTNRDEECSSRRLKIEFIIVCAIRRDET